MYKHIASLLLLMVAIVWGWTFVVVKDAVDAQNLLGFLALRFTIAAIVMAPIVATRRLSWKTLRMGLLIGLALGVSYLFQTWGLVYATASSAALITGLAVLFAPIVSRWVFGVSIRTCYWIATVVALVGLALLQFAGPTEDGAAPAPNAAPSVAAVAAPDDSNDALDGTDNGDDSNTKAQPSAAAVWFGNFLTLLCALGFGLHIAMLDRYAVNHDALELTFWQIVTSAALFWMLWPIFNPPVYLPPWTVAAWWPILLTGVVASALAFFIQTSAQQHISVERTAVIISMEPVFGALFGHLLHHDTMVPLQYVGAVLMIGTVLFVEVYAAWRTKQGEEEKEV